MDGRRFEIVGLVRGASYRNLRQAMLPVVYTAFHEDKGRMMLSGTLIVRTAPANPLALASLLRREVSRAQPEFRVTSIQAQQELIDAQTVRERLLAMLALLRGRRLAACRGRSIRCAGLFRVPATP